MLESDVPERDLELKVRLTREDGTSSKQSRLNRKAHRLRGIRQERERNNLPCEKGRKREGK